MLARPARRGSSRRRGQAAAPRKPVGAAESQRRDGPRPAIAGRGPSGPGAGV